MKNTTFKMRVSEEWLGQVREEAAHFNQSVAEFIREAVDWVLACAPRDVCDDCQNVEPVVGVSVVEKEEVKQAQREMNEFTKKALEDVQPNVIKEVTREFQQQWKPAKGLSKKEQTRRKKK